MTPRHLGSFGRSVVLLSLAAGACTEPGELGVRAEAITSGTPDVVVGPTGVVVDDVRQWVRDAAVSITWGCPDIVSHCSGVLVSPRVVLTNAHCVRPDPRPGFGGYSVTFSPINPAGVAEGGVPPPGSAPRTCVPVIHCETHPDSRATCFDTGTPESVNTDRDLAVLILEERVDHGLTGGRTQGYHAIPAHVRERDPVDVGEVEDPNAWDGHIIAHVGYGPIAESPLTVFGPVRMVVLQAVLVGDDRTHEWSSSITLGDRHGTHGDSGGPWFSARPTHGPAEVLAINTGTTGVEPGYDHGVRLTSQWIQSFLARFLGDHNAHYPGATVLIAGTEVWTGDVDVPPREEGFPRAVFGIEEADRIDPDGDGLVAGHDNCWGIHNPDQNVADPGGIGAPGAELRTCTTALGAPVTYSCLPTGLGLEADIDPDHDSIPSPCDNCPGAWNPWQEDCNGDGDGNACGIDRDFDGTTDDCDNCRSSNPDQANCNLDSELDRIARGVEAPSVVRGDICDPTPCGESRIGTRDDGATLFMDRLEVRPRTTRELGEIATGYRDCPCSVSSTNRLSTRRACSVPIVIEDPSGVPRFDGSGDCDINAIPVYDLPVEPQTWRWVTTTAGLNREAALRYDAHRPLLYDTSLHLASDVRRWGLLSHFPDAYPVVGLGSGDPIGLVFWTHTAGAPATTRELASNYLSGGIDGPLTFLPPGRFDARAGVPMGVPELCPACAASFPMAFAALPATGVPGLGGIQMMFGASTARAIDVSPSLSNLELPAVETWIAASDSPSAMPETGLRFVGLASGATGTASLLMLHAGALVDEKVDPCGQCLVLYAPPDLSLAGSEIPPAPRSGYSAVLSAAERRIWIAGGVDEAGESVPDLYEHDLARGTWLRLAGSSTLGTVRALAWSSVEHALFVIDETGESRAPRSLRLLRVAPGTGEIDEDVRWPRGTEARDFALTADPSGTLWLVVSDPARGTHAVLRMARPPGTRARAGHVLTGSATGDGTLVPGGVAASALGASVLVQTADGTVALGYRESDLRPGRGEPGRWL